MLAPAALAWKGLSTWYQGKSAFEQKKKKWEWETETLQAQYENKIEAYNLKTIANDAKFMNAGIEAASANLGTWTEVGGKLNQLQVEQYTAQQAARVANWENYVKKTTGFKGIGTTGRRGSIATSAKNTAAEAAVAATKTAMTLANKVDLITSKGDALIDKAEQKTWKTAMDVRKQLAIQTRPPVAPSMPPAPDPPADARGNVLGTADAGYNLGFTVFAPGEGWRPSHHTG